jgi:hypothetical protein
MLVHEQVGRAFAIDLQAVAVVPLDVPPQLIAVVEDDDHRRAVVHLLDVVEGLGARVLGRNLASPMLRSVLGMSGA